MEAHRFIGNYISLIQPANSNCVLICLRSQHSCSLAHSASASASQDWPIAQKDHATCVLCSLLYRCTSSIDIGCHLLCVEVVLSMQPVKGPFQAWYLMMTKSATCPMQKMQKNSQFSSQRCAPVSCLHDSALLLNPNSSNEGMHLWEHN